MSDCSPLQAEIDMLRVSLGLEPQLDTALEEQKQCIEFVNCVTYMKNCFSYNNYSLLTNVITLTLGLMCFQIEILKFQININVNVNIYLCGL